MSNRKSSYKENSGLFQGARSVQLRSEFGEAISNLYDMHEACQLDMETLIREFDGKVRGRAGGIPPQKGSIYLRINYRYDSQMDRSPKAYSISWRKITYYLETSSGRNIRSKDLPGRLQMKNIYSHHCLRNKQLLKEYDAKAERLNRIMKKILKALSSIRSVFRAFNDKNAWDYETLKSLESEPSLLVRNRRTKAEIEKEKQEKEDEEYGFRMQEEERKRNEQESQRRINLEEREGGHNANLARIPFFL